MLKGAPLLLKLLFIISLLSLIDIVLIPFGTIPSFNIFGSPQSPVIATSLILILTTLNLLFAYSIVKRFSWGWKIFIATNSFQVMNFLIGVYFNSGNYSSQEKIGITSFSLILTLLQVIVIIYVYSQRKYFNN